MFGAWQGKAYSDNAKYFFEYVNQNYNQKCVWITKRPEIVDLVRSKGYRCYLEKSLLGMFYVAVAKAAVETEGDYDISFLLNPKKTIVIQLWHGMGTKSMKWKDEDGNLKVGTFKRFQPFNWMSPSILYNDIISELLHVPQEHFYLTGYPRNDTFISKPFNKNVEDLKSKYSDFKFVIYMPTHRHFGKDGNKHINIEQLKYVDKQLEELKVKMVYKPHIHELKNFYGVEGDFSNIILAKDEEIWSDVYSYLHYFDLLISDYSSVISDFMCSGKPIILFTYDIDEYISGDAELNSYFWELQGGPMCKTWDEVLSEIKKQLTDDVWKEERERCCREYHHFNDGKNSDRVYQTVLKLINR